MKKTIRFVASILCIMLIIQGIPLYVYAENGYSENISGISNNVEESDNSDTNDAYILEEDISLRDEYTKHFKMSNGTYLAVQYNLPVHKLNANNEWICTAESFSFVNADETANDFDCYISNAGDLTAKVAANSNESLYKLYQLDGIHPLVFELISDNKNTVNAQTVDLSSELENETAEEKNTRIINTAYGTSAIKYTNLINNVDFSYYNTQLGFEQSIVLYNSNVTDFTFILTATDMDAALDSNGYINVTDETGALKYVISAPFMYDAENKYSNSINYELTNNNDNTYTLTLSIDNEWITNENVVYPLTVNSVITTPINSNTSIDGISVTSTSTSFSNDQMTIGKNEDGVYRTYITVNDLPELKDSDVFISAKLRTQQYYIDTQNDENLLSISAYSVTEDWNTSTINWNAQPRHNERALVTLDFGGVNNVLNTCDWNVTEEIQKYYNNEPSYGVVFISEDELDNEYLTLPKSLRAEFTPYIMVNYINMDAIKSMTSDGETAEESLTNNSTSEFHEVASSVISIDDVNSTTTSTDTENITTIDNTKVFDEITDTVDIKYYLGENEIILNENSTTQIDGVKLTTNNNKFYLRYQSKNKNKGWLPWVYSTKNGPYDYAGWYGYAMTHLSIEVYMSNGTRVYDDYVVMYRAKVNGAWLNWVSNGQPDVMRTIQSEYGLDGDLDIACTDAGYESLGDIQNLQIRVFERKVKVGTSGSASVGDFEKVADGSIYMGYYKNGETSETEFDGPIAISNSLNGIRLQTTDKPYYFLYRFRRQSNLNWLSFVDSRNSGATDYAGLYGQLMTNLEIRVYSLDGTRLFDNYVVMYRTKVNGSWLDWVSNGQPEIMNSIYSCDEFAYIFNKENDTENSGLDTSATDAGDYTQGKIEAIEIHVFERENLIVIPNESTIYLENVPYINQNTVGLPNGCESVSTVMALQYLGIEDIDSAKFVTQYLDMGPRPVVNGIGPDPNEVFAGDPSSKNGWGCYAPVIIKALNKFISKYNGQSKLINFEDLLKESNDSSETDEIDPEKALNRLCGYIDNGIPVIMWATVGMTDKYQIREWTTTGGDLIKYNNKLHCLLLVGYDDTYYYFNDPLQPSRDGYTCVGYLHEDVENAFELLNFQAIVVQPIDGKEIKSSIGKTTESITQDEVQENDSKGTNSAGLVADPIDLGTGAHIMSHDLMTIYGAQTLSFTANYKSNLLTEGSLGVGWSHNYEKKLIVDEDEDKIYVFDNVTYYSVYTKSADNDNVYTSDTIGKENYTITKTSEAYVVNCNHKFTEYYDIETGDLKKITSKSGFNTLITYPENNTTKITDELSGRYILVTKDANGKITSIADNAGRCCTLEYMDNCLTSITDENGNTISYLYNDKKQILRGMDALGTVYFTNEYDSLDRIIRQTDGSSDNNVTVINYDEATLEDHILITVFDRTNQVTVYKYNSSKQLISKTDANGNTTVYDYDDAGNLTKQTDGLGNYIINKYDGRNNLIEVTENITNLADNTDIAETDIVVRTTTYEYDNNNNLTKITYPNGGTVSNVYDDKNRITSSTDLRGVVTTYEYDTYNQLVKTTCLDKSTEYEYLNGQMVSVTDKLDNKTTNEYNEFGFLKSVTDANNKKTQYFYDNKGNVVKIIDAANNVTLKEYDANGSLIKSTDAKGNSTTYTYDGNLNMTSMTLPNGATLYYTYDNEDRLICVSYPDGTTTKTEYDVAGRVIKQIDKDNNTVSYEYDAANRIIKTTNANGGITTNKYDALGNVIETKIGKNNITSYEYDIMGNLIKATNALGHYTTYTYNAAGNLLTVTDPLGNTTTNTYDSLGNLVSVTEPRGNTTAYTYDALGNLLTVTNALNQTTTHTYDNLYRLKTATDAGGHTVTYGYDELGRLTSTTDARGYTTHQYYDALGNVIKITDQSDNIDFEAVFDEMGNATEITDAAGNKTINRYDYSGNLIRQQNALGEVSTYTYNGNGQMISSVDKAGGISYATYDGMGNLTSMTGPTGSLKEYVYNSLGHITSESSVNGTDELYRYNALGIVIKKRDAAYAYTTYSYDAAGRITSFTDDAGTVSYTYDANGNVLTVTDSTGTITREYDALNRVTKYTDVHGNIIEYEYNTCGALSKMIYPNGEIVSYTYDANHNMLSASPSNIAYATTYEYNEQNQITKIYRPDGSVCTNRYDTAGRLTNAIDIDANGDYLVVDAYTYDVLGRIVEEVNIDSYSWYKMTYDSLGRLTKRVEKDVRYSNTIRDTQEFTYDAAGNILTDCDGNTFKYKENNVIEFANGFLYYTDNKGNTGGVIDNSFVSAGYDARNRITNVNSNEYMYSYDAENNRISMTTETTSTLYTHDSSDGRNRLVWSKDEDNVVTIYGYGADGLAWSVSNGVYMFYHFDYRGSVVAVTNIECTVTDEIKYDAYGSVAERTGTSEIIFGYNGKYGVISDPNGLLYMRSRYYNPELKRFMNADVLDGSISDSTTLNLYAYVNGNPVSFVDPFGFAAERERHNSSVISDIKGLYDIAYNFYTNVSNEDQRMKFANDATMKYIMYYIYYENTGFLKNLAWEEIAGNVDYSFMSYMEQFPQYRNLQLSTFYDPDSGDEIDFVHMIATLNANYFDRFFRGSLNDTLNSYAGWAGDLITLAGDVNKNITTKDCDIVELTKKLMRGNDSSFPASDLIGDIDAVLINEYMSTMSIDKAFEAYYSYDYKDRYSKFFAKEFGGYINNVYSSAEYYLSPSLCNLAFRKAFNSEYSNDIIPYVAQGFTEYFVYEVGR